MNRRVWTLSFLTCAAVLSITSGYSIDIRKAPGPTATVQLMDVSNGHPVRNAVVRLVSDNGIRCMHAPCPTHTRTWEGKSDTEGFVQIPTSEIQSSTQIETESLTGDLIDDSDAVSDTVWIAELLPLESTYADPPGPPRPLRLIDGTTSKAVVYADASFEMRRGSESRVLFKTRTNDFGYVFLPNDLPEGALENTWVVVTGYRATHVDFAWAAHRTRLVRRQRQSQVLPQ